MKICIIHGSPRKKGNTALVVEQVITHLDQFEDNTYTYFYLNNDTLSFCNGCYNCFFKGEETCPHNHQIQPIIDAMIEADGVILTSPVYVMGESGQIKTFMDHLAYQYIVHRPKEVLFKTIGLAISTTAGAPTKPALKCIRKNMRFWGFSRTIGLGLSLYEMSWDKAPKSKQKAFKKHTRKTAIKFYDLMKKRQRITFNPFRSFWMGFIKKMRKGEADSLDKRYWIEKGWVKGDIS